MRHTGNLRGLLAKSWDECAITLVNMSEDSEQHSFLQEATMRLRISDLCPAPVASCAALLRALHLLPLLRPPLPQLQLSKQLN